MSTTSYPGRPSAVYLYVVAVIAAVGGFLFGYDLSIVSGAELFLTEYFNLSAESRGFAVGCAILGCMLGALFVAMGLSDWLGRKKVLLITAVLFGVGAVGTALPRTIFEFNVYRIIGGIGVGVASIVSPMYIAEIAPARVRGRLVIVNQLAIVSGALISAVVAYYLTPDLSGLDPNVCWRWMFATACVPILALHCGLTLLPESPRWLAKKGRLKQARAVLAKIDGPVHAEQEIQAIHEASAEESGRFAELALPGIRTALFIAVMLAMLQQFTGVSSLLFFTPRVFQMTGFASESDAIFQSAVMLVWNLFCTCLALWLVERLGRRPLLIAGCIGMAVGLFTLGWCFHFHVTGYWTLVPLFLSVGAYNLSIAPLAWLIMSEIFPNRIRGKAMAIASLTLWVAAYLGAQAFPVLVDVMETRYGSPAGTFWVYSLVCLYSVYFAWAMVIETKGKSLEEIGRSWIGK